MRFLPIVGRELRGASRRRGTYWVRTAVAGGAVLIGVVIFLATLNTPVSTAGGIIFRGLAGLLFLCCLAAGRRSTVDCLSWEKREGTLGLLFLTDLKGYDIVLGKLAATSLNGFYALLAVMPVLALSMLLGGISYAEFWRMALVLADTFLFSLAIGIFSSSVSRDARRASATNFVLLLLFIGIPFSVMGILAWLVPAIGFIPQLFYTCPILPFGLCFDTNYVKLAADFWWSMGTLHALTWMFVILASLIVPRTWQDRPLGIKKTSARSFWRIWNRGQSAAQVAHRRRLLEVNPFYWLAARARLKPLRVWLFLLAMAGWWIWGRLALGPSWLGEAAVVVLFSLIIHTGLKLWVALEASQQLAEDQRMGTLELLLPTPLGVRDILRGQELAMRRQFWAPLTVVIAVELFLAWKALQLGHNQDTYLMVTIIMGAIRLLADVIALTWVGMRRALTAKSGGRATIGAVTRILVLPWVVVVTVNVLIAVCNVLWPEFAMGPQDRFKLGLWLWFGMGICGDFYFGLTARRQLLKGFHRLAMHRYDAKPSRLARWFGGEMDFSASHEPADARRVRVPWWRRKRVYAGIAVLALLATGFFVLRRPREHKYPPPVVVTITRSNAPVMISPGSASFLVLPDGSLWRWGVNSFGQPSGVEVPEPVGEARDWVQVVADYWGGVGLKRDGTLWGWGWSLAGNPSKQGSAEMKQIGNGHDWASVTTGGYNSLAIKRDGSLWAWGDNSAGQSGNGAGTNEPVPIQSGTNRDWATILCRGGGVIGLRKDGTLWAWGRSRRPVGGVTTNLVPTRICRETNWTAIEPGWGYALAAWTDSGELWELPTGPPNPWEKSASKPGPETEIASIGRRILTNSGPGRFAISFTGQFKACQVRNDGTLWEADAFLRSPSFNLTLGTNWQRVGKRPDWVFIRGGRTVLGLTADGTIWTWGVDNSRKPEILFSDRLKYLRAAITQLFTRSAAGVSLGATPVYVDQPRPLMRLGAPAAADKSAGARDP